MKKLLFSLSLLSMASVYAQTKAKVSEQEWTFLKDNVYGFLQKPAAWNWHDANGEISETIDLPGVQVSNGHVVGLDFTNLPFEAVIFRVEGDDPLSPGVNPGYLNYLENLTFGENNVVKMGGMTVQNIPTLKTLVMPKVAGGDYVLLNNTQLTSVVFLGGTSDDEAKLNPTGIKGSPLLETITFKSGYFYDLGLNREEFTDYGASSENLKKIVFDGSKVNGAVDIQGFQNLVSIEGQNVLFSNGALTFIGMPKLEKIAFPGQATSSVQSLSLNTLPLLKEVVLSNHQLSDVSSGLANAGAVALTKLDISNNLFSDFNYNTFATGVPNLEELILTGNPITSLTIENASKLKKLGIEGMTQLEQLTLNNLRLTSLSLGSQKPLSATLSEMPLTEHLKLNDSKFKELNLIKLDVTDAGFQWGNAKFVGGVADLKIDNLSNLTTLTISNTIDADGFGINKADIANMNGLTTLNLANNAINEFVTSNVPNVKNLNLDGNQLQTVSVSSYGSLEKLEVRDNKIQQLTLSGVEKLKEIYADKNRFVNLSSIVGDNASQLDALETISAKDNRMTSANMTSGSVPSNLKNLYLDKNPISSVELTLVNTLEKLSLTEAGIDQIATAVSASAIPAGLKELDLSNNPLATAQDFNINLLGLEKLNLYSTPVQAIRMEGADTGTALQFNTSLDPSVNTSLKCIAVEDLNIAKLPDYRGNAQTVLASGYNKKEVYINAYPKAQLAQNCHVGVQHTDEVKVKSAAELKVVNPMKEQFIITGADKVSKVEIYNMAGQIVKSFVGNNQNVSDLTKGIYVAKITFGNGEVASVKVVKN